MPPKQKNGEELLLLYKYLLRPKRNKKLLSLLLYGLFPVKGAICGHKSKTQEDGKLNLEERLRKETIQNTFQKNNAMILKRQRGKVK